MSERRPVRGGRHRAARVRPLPRGRPDRVTVRIDPAGKTLEGRLEWRDPSEAVIGEQSFPSRTGDCDELTRAMGFALALQVQLMAATVEETRAPRPPPATLAPAPSVVFSPPSPTTQIETAEPERRAPTTARRPLRVNRCGRVGGFGLASIRSRSAGCSSPPRGRTWRSSWLARPSPRRPRIARTGPASLRRNFWRAWQAVACAPRGASARSERSASFGWPARASTCRSPPRA